MSFLRNQVDRLRNLWRRALEENSSPKKFAGAVAVGAFISAAPTYGARMPLAMLLAWIFRLNRLTAVLACHIVFVPFVIVVYYWEIRLGSLILARAPPPIDLHMSMGEILRVAKHAIGVWLVGAAVIAPAFGVACGLVAYPISKRYQERKARLSKEKASSEAG